MVENNKACEVKQLLSTSFDFACKNQQIEVVKFLLNDKNVEVNQVDNEGKTPFYISCQNGYIEVVKLLLSDQRVDVNQAENSIGQTPLMVAYEKEHIEIVKLQVYLMLHSVPLLIRKKNF